MVFLNKFKVAIDTNEFSKKPTPFETSVISNNIGKNLIRLSLSDLISEIEKGKSVMLSELATINIKSEFISQQLFFVDIDNTNDNYLTYEQALEMEFVKKNAIFMYKTFSSSQELDRYRICFATENVMTKQEYSETIYEYLLNIFPTADTSCKNYNRIFYGTNSKVTVINWDNRLKDLDILVSNSKEITERLANLETQDDIISIPNWVLIKLGKDDVLKQKLAKYSMELADITQFTEYFKRLDMCEFLELPHGTSFNDIFHDETNPSANVFTMKSGVQLYKCHSQNHKFTGDLIRVIARLKNCGIISATNYLLMITNCKEVVSEELKELRDSIEVLKNLLLSEDLKEQYPELDKYVMNYRTDMVAVLDILKSSTYWDIKRKDYRALFYYSTKTLTTKLGYNNEPKYVKRVQRVLNLMSYLMFIDKLTTEDTPKMLLNQLEKSKQENRYSRRVNVIEARKFTDESFEIIFEQCQKMFKDNFTLGGFNREYLLRTESELVANRVFPQEDSTLETVTNRYETDIAKYIFNKLEYQNYVLEKDIREQLRLEMKSQKLSDTKWKTIRTDIMTTYDLERIRLNKVKKEEFNITDMPYTSSPFILIRKESNKD